MEALGGKEREEMLEVREAGASDNRVVAYQTVLRTVGVQFVYSIQASGDAACVRKSVVSSLSRLPGKYHLIHHRIHVRSSLTVHPSITLVRV